MKLAVSRRFSNLEGKRLRRARRLYLHLIVDHVQKNKELAMLFAFRGIKAGLWAESTGMKDVTFTIIRASYKKYGKDCDWWEYCRSEKCGGLWFKAKEFFRFSDGQWVQTKKLRVRLTN